MELRKVGRSDLKIAPLVLGGNVFGWTADEATSFALIDAFLDAGYNAIDTADIYSNWIPGHEGGESERVIGAWLKARRGRDRIVLATKIGATPRSPEEGGRGRGWAANLSSTYLVEAVERSLRRLQTDYLDLCQSHVSDPETPLDETLEAYGRLIASGKVRVIGASNHDAATLRRALALSENGDLPRYESLQALYNLSDRAGFEEGPRGACIDNDVGVLCYAGLARGFLTGGYRAPEDARKSQWAERVEAQMSARGGRILATLDAVAQLRTAMPGEVALAWLIGRPGVTAAIAAVNSISELNAIAGAGRLTLAPEDLEVLSAASEPEQAEKPTEAS